MYLVINVVAGWQLNNSHASSREGKHLKWPLFVYFCSHHNIIKLIICKCMKAGQRGFRKMHRTVDSIFTLKTLIDEYVKSKPQQHWNLLFSCFVDFRKAFDCIRQQKLVNKLRKEGVNGRFLDILISMYSNDQSAVEINDKLNQSFTCKGKVPCCHLLFLISMGRTTHVTMDMCFLGREHISLGICVSQVGNTYH